MFWTIAASELRPGMYVHDIITSEHTAGFTFMPGVVISPADIEQFHKHHIETVVIDEAKSQVEIFTLPRAQIAAQGVRQKFSNEYILGSLLKLTNDKLAVVTKASNDASDAIELMIFYDLITKTNTELTRIEVTVQTDIIDCIINPDDFDEELSQFLKIIAQ